MEPKDKSMESMEMSSEMGSTVAPNAENVFVSVRLRPLNRAETTQGQRRSWRVQDSRCLVLMERNMHHTTHSEFPYDRVFEPEEGAETVYADVARPMVNSAMHGMNATIFAYGQTGSGKTYTMRSVMELATAHIFGHVQKTEDREFFIRVSAVEIYNEIVRDLLAQDDGCGPLGTSLRVLDDQERGPVVEGLTEEGVSSIEHMQQILKTVQIKRQVRETKANECSSRSHTIVRVNVESRCNSPNRESDPLSVSSEHEDVTDDGAVTISMINFVDLAGSERSKEIALHDHEEKARMREGCHINKSLLALGTVIRNLADGQGKKYISYRDSRLTRILQPSLSGNARMAIICTISPASGAIDTSRAALHFATCAKNVRMQPKVNEVIDSKAMMKRLQAEITQLRKQLAKSDARYWENRVEPVTPTGNMSQLNATIKIKDEVIRSTAEDRDALQRRLKILEQMILGGKQSTNKRRASWGYVSDEGTAFDSMRKTFKETGTSLFSSGELPNIWNTDIQSYPRRKTGRASCSMDCDQSQPIEESLLGSALSKKHSRNTLCSRIDSPFGVSNIPGQVENYSGDEKWASPSKKQRTHRAAESYSGERSNSVIQQMEVNVGTNIQCHQVAGMDCSVVAKPEESTVSEVASDSSNDVMESIQSDLNRLDRAEKATEVVEQALEALKQKLNSMSLKDDTPASSDPPHNPEFTQPGDGPNCSDAHSECILLSPRPISSPSPTPSQIREGGIENQAQGSVTFEFVMPCPSTPTSPVASYGGQTSNGFSTHNDAGAHASLKVTASATVGSGSRQSSATTNGSQTVETSGSENTMQNQNKTSARSHKRVLDWCKKEVQCIQSSLKESTQKDLSCLRSCLKQYEKLECQKKLLLKQVLELQFQLEESQKNCQVLEITVSQNKISHQQLQTENSYLKAQLEEVEQKNARLKSLEVSSKGPDTEPASGGVLMGLTPIHQETQNIFDGDSWADAPSVETLLPKIVQLWSELHTPLSRRSRFLISFRGRESFYYEVEHRRLLWEKNQLGECFDDETSSIDIDNSSVTSKPHGHTRLEKARKKLEWERRWLAVQLKWSYSESARDELYKEWGIPCGAKERKMKLLYKIWDDETVRQPDGLYKSANLVLNLYGPDPREDAEHILFRSAPEDQEIPGVGFFGRLSRRLSRRNSVLIPSSNANIQ